MIGGRNPNAWNNWYHAVGSTYGTWIRGDQRGFRTFRHRQHVEGDYRKPPSSGLYTPIFEYTKKRMRFPPVILTPDQQQILLHALCERLQSDGVEVVALAVAKNHFHLLARFPPLTAEIVARHGDRLLRDGRDPAPRHYLSLARKHASERLRAVGLKPPSPVWAARPKMIPIENRRHQVCTATYVVDHARQGARVWHISQAHASAQ